MDIERLTQSEVAALLGVDVRTVRNFHQAHPPLPRHQEGKAMYYRWPDVLRWRDAREALRKPLPQSDDVPDERLARARLTQAKAEREEYALAIERKTFVSIHDVEASWSELVTGARNNLLAIPARLIVSIGDEAARQVEAEIKRALRVLGGELEE